MTRRILVVLWLGATMTTAHADGDDAASDDSEVIEVSGEAPHHTEPASYRLSGDEVTQVAGTGDDVLRAAQALPGVSRIPYSFGGLVVRGTSPGDTAVYLDGVEVPIAFHFGGLASFYPSEMLADLAVIPGGFDASYGRAQGGIVTLTTREPRTDRWRVGGSMDLLTSSVEAEGPVAGGGVIVGVRRSYVDAVAGPFVSSDVQLPSYWDAQVRGSFGDAARAGRITPMVFLSIDHLADHASGAVGQPDHYDITSMFVRAAVPYLRQWGSLGLRVVPWIGTNRLSYLDVDQGAPRRYQRPMYPAGLRVEMTRDFTWGHLRGGLDSEGGYLSQAQFQLAGFGGGQLLSGNTTMLWLDAALWGEARVVIVPDRFSIKPGVRLDSYGLSHEWIVDPRVNLELTLTPALTLHAALGRYHQPPTPADLDPLDGNPAAKSSYFDQASLGLDATLADGTTGSIIGFYEDGKQLLVPRDPLSSNGVTPILELLLDKQLGLPSYEANVGRGRSYGVELLVKRRVGRWFGMLAYTLAKSERSNPQTGMTWHRYELDQRHDLNIAGSVALEAWTLGARIQVTTGNPYTPETCMPASDGESWTCQQGAYGASLPVFFQLDVRADHVWRRQWGDLHFYLDIQNATNRANVEAREFNSYYVETGNPDQDVLGLPILPFIGVKLVPR